MMNSAADIQVGNHLTVAGFNLDTIWSTLFAGAVVIVLGLLVARRASSGVPSGPQLLWETVVGGIQGQVQASLGLEVAPFAVPLGVTLFVFILVCNLLEIIPSHGLLPAPTGDVNLVFAMAIFVIIWVHIWGTRRSGARTYWGHFFNPPDRPFALRPLNVIEEITKPITLTLRLFGNIFASAIMIELIGLFPAFISWAPNVIWKLFAIFVALIQAFIFALLTILYFSFADMSEEGGH